MEYPVKGIGGSIAPTYDEAAAANELLHGLAKESAVRALVEKDKPLDDATMQMLSMAQGFKGFPYVFPELTASMRGVNSIAEKDMTRLVGIPRQKDISAFLVSPESRDKVLWTVTGNAMKADATANRLEGSK
jgi:hypothetical protein